MDMTHTLIKDNIDDLYKEVINEILKTDKIISYYLRPLILQM